MFTKQDLEDYIKDLKEDGESPIYETEEYDLIMNVWTDYFDPVDILKEHGYYEKLRELVQKTTITEILYRGIEKGSDTIIDYSNELTQWYTSYEEAVRQNAPDFAILRCEFKNIKGMKIFDRDDNARIMDGMKLEIIDNKNADNIISVKIVHL